MDTDCIYNYCDRNNVGINLVAYNKLQIVFMKSFDEIEKE